MKKIKNIHIATTNRTILQSRLARKLLFQRCSLKEPLTYIWWRRYTPQSEPPLDEFGEEIAGWYGGIPYKRDWNGEVY